MDELAGGAFGYEITVHGQGQSSNERLFKACRALFPLL